MGSGDLGVWQANFGAGNPTAGAVSAASEFAIAALVADEEPAEFVVDGDEGFGSADVGSAADAAFAWLAADRTATDRGGWQRSARETELLARDWAARSVLLATTAESDLRHDEETSVPASKLREAELAFDGGTAPGDSERDDEEWLAKAFDRSIERLAPFSRI